ncbi:MAG: aminotransferase class I/II-fold pyridoxal phosphate-dependent enzyme [Bacilli bacterium]|nr:aminotransferase class I/II-fold pyridoxal phosphate-dependent enzyme [Bacilli bacterium]
MKELSKLITKMKPSGIREFFNYASERPDVISLSVGEPDFVTPKPIINSAKRSLDEGKTFYTSNQGLPILREKISKYLDNRFNVKYDKEEIILTSGSSQGILTALLALINPGDEIIVTEPTYICYVPDIEMCGGKAVVISLSSDDGYKLTPDLLKKYITNKTKAIFLSYPNNPTGAVMTKEDLELLLPIIVDNDLYVISDEIYAELTYNNRHCSIASLSNMKERTILISGFSKAFAMTGWRLGYVCAPKEILDEILKIQQYIMLSAPTTAQYGAITALDECMDGVSNMVNEYNNRRIYLLNSFKELGIDCFESGGAFYLFPSIKRFNMTSREFCLKLLNEYNVLVVPGTAFGESGEGYIRVSYAASKDKLETFISVLRQMLS